MSDSTKAILSGITAQLILKLLSYLGVAVGVSGQGAILQVAGGIVALIAAAGAEYLEKLQKQKAVDTRTVTLIGDVTPSMEKAIVAKEAQLKDPDQNNPAPIILPSDVPSVSSIKKK